MLVPIDRGNGMLVGAGIGAGAAVQGNEPSLNRPKLTQFTQLMVLWKGRMSDRRRVAARGFTR
jgi:hypothetical protein